MKKIFTVAFIVLIAALTVQAQRHFCGTSAQDQYDIVQRLIQNRENAAHYGTAGQRDVDYYVPIKFHLVGKGDGSQVVSEALVLDMLCNLNEAYEDQDIQFYLKMPFNYIYNDVLYNEAQSSGGQFQISANKVQNAMNIFIVGNFPQSGLLGYYQGPPLINDFIVIKKSATYGNTAPHEVGHFFGLAHPFFGWEEPSNPNENPYFPNNYQGWSEEHFGNPVSTNSPSYDLQSPVQNEKQDQSNCTQAADAICDTPPDYLFAFSASQSGCNTWNGGAMDPNGDIVDPSEINMMSYFGQCATYEFTPGQKDAIIEDLESPQRNYVRPDYTPSTTEVTGTPELVEPIDGETTNGYTEVGFDWEPVAGAEYYLLEIDFIPTFTGSATRYVVSGGSYKIVEGIFNDDQTYYWRVRPFGQYVTCGTSYSSTGNFKTGTQVSVKEIQAVNGWNVKPNPVSSSQVLNIEIDAAQSFDAVIQMYNTTGQLVKTITKQNFQAGLSNHEMNIAGLSAGVYFLTISSEEGIMNKKVVVTK